MHAHRGSIVLAVCLLLGAAYAQYDTGAPSTWECRMAPGAAHTGCGLPYELVRGNGLHRRDWTTVLRVLKPPRGFACLTQIHGPALHGGVGTRQG